MVDIFTADKYNRKALLIDARYTVPIIVIILLLFDNYSSNYTEYYYYSITMIMEGFITG